MLELKHLSKIFTDNGQREPVLADISLTVKSGEIFVFLGPSGSGKSTILRLMSGLDKDYRGEIIRDPALSPNDFAFVFQQFALLPWLTVEENIELWLIARQVPPAERRARVKREMAIMKLTHAAGQYPRQLSGGMRQRVGIARALAIEPKVIFMDEPFSELDSFTAHGLRQELLNIWQERQLTIVLVTHLLDEAIELGDRIAVLSERPARLLKILPNPLPRPRLKRSEPFYKLEDELYGLL